jgi:hypothetical protein
VRDVPGVARTRGLLDTIVVGVDPQATPAPIGT